MALFGVTSGLADIIHHRQFISEAERRSLLSSASFHHHSTLVLSGSNLNAEAENSATTAKVSSRTIVQRFLRAEKDLLIAHSSAASRPLNEFPAVKMCGITNPSDAAMAAEAGANLIGMILYPKSKRSVSLDTAKEIARVAKERGVEPVGVFVDEDAPTIQAWCSAAGLSFAQLHGDVARAALSLLPSSLKVIYVLHADNRGILQTRVPAQQECASIDWILIDGLQGGSGLQFDWGTFRPPPVNSRNGWFLAGGLKPENVSEAISMLKPDGVDVSSGITDQDGICKDLVRIGAFMDAVRRCGNLYKL